MGVGCRLYHAGSPRGPAYDSHPWRKGCLHVRIDQVHYIAACFKEPVVTYAGVAFEHEPMLEPIHVAILGYACTLLRLSVGYVDRATVPPHTQVW